MKKIQKKYRDLPSEALLRIICQVADGQKARDLVALDVRGLASFADYFVLMSGTSTRHVQGLADTIDGEIGSKRMKVGGAEGLADGNWVLLDYNDIVVHIFHHESRSYYDLEGLWHDAPRLDPFSLPELPEELAEAVAKPKRKVSAAVKKLAAGEPAAAAKKKASVASARKTARAIKIAAHAKKSNEAKKASIIEKKKAAARKKTGGAKRK